MTTLQRQHLIDPEVCIRCNTCEEACPVGAIHHDRRNYVVKFEACTGCNACLPPCPTGAIDSWRSVAEPWTEAQQYAWDALPPDTAPSSLEPEPDAVAELSAQASAVAGRVSPPWSAAHPYVGLYSEARPVTATVSGNHRLTAEDSTTDIRHLVLDFGAQAFPYLEGQSVGIVPPGVDAIGRPHHVRLYSVASPRDGERPRHNNLALTVKRVTQDHEGRLVNGVASNYLCDLKRGDRVQVTGPWGATFLMPNHPGSNLLMVCTGTGAAPMRAMTERRRRRGPAGELLLFFGARLRTELPYFGPLMKLPPELIGVELAFSRERDTPKQYVQDRMRLQAGKVARLLADPQTFVYLCGHKRMELGVLEAFRDIAAAHALDWPQLLQQLKAEGRFHVETY